MLRKRSSHTPTLTALPRHDAGDRHDANQIQKVLTLQWNSQDELLVNTLPALELAFKQTHDQLLKWRIQQGQLDFADLEGGALRALEHADVRNFYQKRFKALLVDECQDTSPTQAQLLRAIIGDAHRTYVGDPLQSIYGFRTGREPMHHALVKEIQALGGDFYKLTHSYRANIDLVVPLNKAMHHLTAGEHLELSASREPPVPSKSQALKFIQSPKEGDRNTRLRAEAKQIVEEIKSLLETNTPVFDSQLGESRPVKPQDFAILSRTWKPLDVFQEELLAANIPAFLAGGGDLLKTAPAQDAWLFLRAAGDPTDDLATAAILRGPLFSWSETELYTLWKNRLPNEHWQAAVMRSIEPSHGQAKKFFQQLRSLRSAPPLEALLLADRYGYRAELTQLPASARAIADWDAVLLYITSLEIECPSPRAAAQRLRQLQTNNFSLPRPPIATSMAVTLTSIHKAKGMEWPIVFVVDLDGRRKPETDPAYITDIGIIFNPDNFTQTKPALLDYARFSKKELEEQELNRLLYVACTRACDRLYASGPVESRSAAYTRLFDSFQSAQG